MFASEDHKKVPPPKGIKDLPRYMRELFGGFFSRLGYIFALVWRTSPWITIALVLIALLEGIVPLIGSLASRNVINLLQKSYGTLNEGDYVAFFGSAVFFALILLFSYRIAKMILNRVKNSVTKVAGEKVIRTVKLQIMNKAKTIDLASFDRPEFYEKLENANREAGNRPVQILTSTLTVASTVISLISYVVILLAVPGMWWIPLVKIVASIPSAVVSFIYRKKHYRYMRFRSKERRQMNYYSNQLVDKDKAKEVKLFDLSDTFIGRFDDVFRHYYKGLRRLILQESWWLVVLSTVAQIVSCVCYAAIAFGVLIGRFLLGDYNLYTNSILSISDSVSSLITTSASIYEGTLFVDNLIEFMKEERTIVPTQNPPEKISRGKAHTIVFEHDSFSYPMCENKVLNDLNFTIRPGETLVLVGLNGAGKTTLIKLLTRLYDPTEGRILLDGKDLRSYDPKELYQIFGIIFQDFGKYAETAKENIRFGDVHREIDEERIVASARQSAADEYIRKLSSGYDTPLMRIFEQDGIELSGGQWQKLAVARAFYSDSDILILDEPTAALDPIAEQEIFRQFDTLRRDKTTVFVSHRLSSATVASKILVLEYGRILEEGDHEELMERKGRYYELFTTQAERYIARGDAKNDTPERGEKGSGRDAVDDRSNGQTSERRPPRRRPPQV